MAAQRADTRVGFHFNNLIAGIPEYNDCKSWIDIGSGNGVACTTMAANGEIPHKVCVDPKAWINDLEKNPPAPFTDETDWVKYRMLYNEECPVWNEKYDLVTCMDTLEHLPKETGEKWLDHFEEIANKIIMIFTPCGFLPQGPEQDPKFDELERHLSGWEVEDFLKRGYCVWRTPNDFHHNPSGVEGDWAAIFAYKVFAIEPKGIR